MAKSGSNRPRVAGPIPRTYSGQEASGRFARNNAYQHLGNTLMEQFLKLNPVLSIPLLGLTTDRDCCADLA